MKLAALEGAAWPGLLWPSTTAESTRRQSGGRERQASVADKITGFIVTVDCDVCQGKGRTPGGQAQYGEVINCPACGGRGWSTKRLPIADVLATLKLEAP